MRKQIPLDRIVRLYRKGLTGKQVGDILGVSRQATWYRLKMAGIPTRPMGPFAVYPEKAVIQRLYFEEGLTVKQTAERLNETPDRVRRAMELHGFGTLKRGGKPKYPQLRTIPVGESIELSKSELKTPYLSFYGMAKNAGIRVSVKRIDESNFRVTRVA